MQIIHTYGELTSTVKSCSEAAEVPSCQGEQVVEKLLPLLLCSHKCILTVTTTGKQIDKVNTIIQ